MERWGQRSQSVEIYRDTINDSVRKLKRYRQFLVKLQIYQTREQETGREEPRKEDKKGRKQGSKQRTKRKQKNKEGKEGRTQGGKKQRLGSGTGNIMWNIKLIESDPSLAAVWVQLGAFPWLRAVLTGSRMRW